MYIPYWHIQILEEEKNCHVLKAGRSLVALLKHNINSYHNIIECKISNILCIIIQKKLCKHKFKSMQKKLPPAHSFFVVGWYSLCSSHTPHTRQWKKNDMQEPKKTPKEKNRRQRHIITPFSMKVKNSRKKKVIRKP